MNPMDYYGIVCMVAIVVWLVGRVVYMIWRS